MKTVLMNNKFTDIFWTAIWAILFIFTLTGLYNSAKADEFAGVSQTISSDFQGNRVLNLLATGVYYRVDEDCTVPDYYRVVLIDNGFYGDTGIYYSGGEPSKVYWRTERTIDSCELDCNEQPVQTDVVHWHSCDVTGVIGGRVSLAPACTDDSPIYSADTGLLFLKNIRIYEGLDDTLLRLNKAILKLDGGVFAIQTVE